MDCRWEKTRTCLFPLAFRHSAGERPSHGHRRRARKNGKESSPNFCASRVVREISPWTHTDTYTDEIITILRNRSRGRRNIYTSKTQSRNKAANHFSGRHIINNIPKNSTFLAEKYATGNFWPQIQHASLAERLSVFDFLSR